MTSPTPSIVASCRYCGPSCRVSYGFCHCECGRETKLCTQDSPRDNWIKGTPMRYIQHHHKRREWKTKFIVLPERPAHIPHGFCWCGCGELAPIAVQSWPRLGVRKGEPMRHIKHHFPYTTGPEYIEEFRSMVPSITTRCWIWQHAKGPDEYGCRHSSDGTSRIAHIAVYERHRGKVPEGLELDHLCQVHPCVNPWHLDAVTHRVNMERGRNSKLNHDMAADIRVRFAEGESRKSLAIAFGVTESTIRAVCQYKTWLRSGVQDLVSQ